MQPEYTAPISPVGLIRPQKNLLKCKTWAPNDLSPLFSETGHKLKPWNATLLKDTRVQKELTSGAVTV